MLLGVRVRVRGEVLEERQHLGVSVSVTLLQQTLGVYGYKIMRIRLQRVTKHPKVNITRLHAQHISARIFAAE